MMFAKRLKKLRSAKEITQAEFAKVIGVAQQAVARWEKEKSEPDNGTLKQLAKYFSVSIDYLLDNEKNNLPVFNDDETKLIYSYRKLDGDGKNLLLGLVKSLSLSHSKQNKNNSNVVQKNSGGHNYLAVNGNQYVG